MTLSRTGPHRPFPDRGFSLIELMIALVLGLLVSAAALNVFISNRETFRVVENLSRIQESARVAFELMTRDLRETGGVPCGRGLLPVNVLDSTEWWATWGDGITAFDNGALAGSTAGTDALQSVSSLDAGLAVSAHDTGTATITLNTAVHGLAVGDIVMACDFTQFSLFQVSAVAGAAIGHNEALAGQVPSNCIDRLGNGSDCAGGAGVLYQYGRNSVVARLRSVRWFVDDNGTGTRSLYRQTLATDGISAGPVTQEVAEGVQDMQLTYLQRGGNAYVASTAITDWADVIGIRVQLTLLSPEPASVDGERLQRRFQHTIALRNRGI